MGTDTPTYAAVAVLVGQLHDWEYQTKTQSCYKMARTVVAAAVRIGGCGSV
jgi:hypothetical protein